MTDDIASTYWSQRAGSVVVRPQAFIDGGYVDPLSGRFFPVVSPIDGKTLGQAALCGPDDVQVAVRSARHAFETSGWAYSAPRERKRTLLRLARLIEENREELALLETVDMGKPIADALYRDLPAVVTCLEFYAEACDKMYGEVAPTPSDVLATVTREPIGVVAAVVPWNFPLLMAMWKVAPALAAGNAVILKPAEQAPLSALRLGELAHEAGVPAGILNVVPGDGPCTGQALGRHMDVDKVAFTGSGAVGKAFLTYAAESNMKSVTLECGGKSPQIVTSDVHDLADVAQAVALGAFYNQGEVCDAGTLLLVERKIKDELISLVVEASEAFRPANPLIESTTMGAIVDKHQMEHVLRYVDQGVQEGANLCTGGVRELVETGGFYIAPTVFAEVAPSMAIAREEIFGPVLSVISFTDVEEAVSITNRSDYGLAASVWARDVSTAHRVAKKVRAGTVYVNSFGSTDINVPFGGYRQSGIGRDKSLHALANYTELKTTWFAL